MRGVAAGTVAFFLLPVGLEFVEGHDAGGSPRTHKGSGQVGWLAGSAVHVILADAELEMVPEEIAGHPAVRKHGQTMGKRPGQLLLDANHHWQASKSLPDGERRGRPDITQMSLMALMESPLNKEGKLEVSIHTRHGEWIHIRPDTRLPRGEQRFQGLMARVLTTGQSQDKDPLIWMERKTANRIVKDLDGPILRLAEGGDVQDIDAVAKEVGSDVTVVIGAFPSGDFSAGWKQAVPETVSIWPEPLVAWAVAAECAAAWRRA